MAHHLPIYQPEKIRDPASLSICQKLNPDIIVVVAYGQILPLAFLAIPLRGCVNVHASLLPKFRGAAPIARAILEGETSTGVTTMLMDEGMDRGPILLREEVPISPQDRTGTLHDRLSNIGAELLQKTLEGLENGTLVPKAQDHSQASYAPKVLKEEGKVDWNDPALQLACRLRAFDPWPGAFTSWSGQVLKLFSPRVDQKETKTLPGTVVEISAEGLTVATGQGALRIGELQLASRPRMKAGEFLKGHSLPLGSRLGD